MKKFTIVLFVLWLAVGTAFAGDYIRFVDGDKLGTGQLQVAVESFTKDGVTVDLYGVVHIADRAYYRRVQADLNKYDAVLYEGIKSGEKRKSKGTNVLSLFQTGMAKVLGLQFQMKGIDYTGKNMVHADIGAGELQRRTKGKSPVGGNITEEQMKLLNPFILRVGVYMELYFMQNPEVRRNLKHQFAKQLAETDIEAQLNHQMRKAIITDRNQIVMNVLKVELRDMKKERFAIFYGAGHNKDFAKRFIAKGWTRGTKRWQTAWSIR